MLNQADEDRKEIAQIDAQIADAEAKLKIKRAGVSALESFLDQKYARRMVVEARIERAEARLEKPTGYRVKITAPDGVEWNL